VSAGGPKPKKATKAKPSTDTPFRRRVSDQFGEAFTEVFGTRYPWVFKGYPSDVQRVTVWIEGAKVKEATPDEGLARLRGAALAYCKAAKAGAAYPNDGQATTHWFTRDLAKWLQTDPTKKPARAHTSGGRAPPMTLMELAQRKADEPPPQPERDDVLDVEWSAR
jgi:hypothetical protein